MPPRMGALYMADSPLCLTGMAMPLGTPLLRPQVSCLTCLCQYSQGSGQCAVIRMKTLPSYEKQQVSAIGKLPIPSWEYLGLSESGNPIMK